MEIERTEHVRQKHVPVLDELFSRMQTGKSPYSALIEPENIWRDVPKSFAKDVVSNEPRDYFRERAAFFKEKLSGKPLVDLGGGRTCTLLPIADHNEASAYINVDKYVGRFADLERNPLRNQYESYFSPKNILRDLKRPVLTSNIEPAFIYADMLDFVARLPDNSANFALFGLDEDIIGGDRRYHEALSKEIARALRGGGIVFGRNSNPLADRMVSNGPTPISELFFDSEPGSNDRFALRVFEKEFQLKST